MRCSWWPLITYLLEDEFIISKGLTYVPNAYLGCRPETVVLYSNCFTSS